MTQLELQSWLDQLGYLSPTEWHVFECLGKGMSTKEITRVPGHICAAKTVESHTVHIKQKLKIGSARELRHLAAQIWALASDGRLTRIELPRTKRYYEVMIVKPLVQVDEIANHSIEIQGRFDGCSDCLASPGGRCQIHYHS